MTLHQLTKPKVGPYRTRPTFNDMWSNDSWINYPHAYEPPNQRPPMGIVRRTVYTRHAFSHEMEAVPDFIREWLTYQLASYVRTHRGFNMGIVRFTREPVHEDPLARFNTYLAEVEAHFPADGVPI